MGRQIPHEIKKQDLLRAVRVLGFDPEEVKSLKLQAGVVTVTRYRKNSEGARYLAENETNPYALETFEIPVTGNEDGQ